MDGVTRDASDVAEHRIRETLHDLYREQSKRKQRVSEIDYMFLMAKQGGTVLVRRERADLAEEKGEHVERLQEIRQLIRDHDATLQAVHRSRALVSFGGEVALTAALKSLVDRCGRMEHVYMLACEWADNPCGRTEKKLLAAINNARGKARE